MVRLIPVLLLFATASIHAATWFDGEPDYADAASRALAAEVLEAHGGMQGMTNAKSIRFSFFTKVIGGQRPFYSIETVDLETGNAYLEWPFWDSTVALSNDEIWARHWPMPMPAGFFARLSASFMTLPWQMHADGANVGPVSTGKLPDDDTAYDVLRVTFDQGSPSIPGTYYDIFVDRETHLVKGVGFDINHPGMVANPNQPSGPNYHVFGEYRRVDGLLIPVFYLTHGGGSNAYHFAWDVSLDQPFDSGMLVAPPDATLDEVSMQWWGLAGTGTQSSAVVIDRGPHTDNGESK